MKAVRIHEHGSVDVLQIDLIDKPKIKPDEALIKIKAASLNHLDIWVRKGIPGIPLPLIMGSDGAGVISDLGELAKRDYDFNIGDEVIAAPIRSCGKCEYCLAGEENLCPDFKIPGEGINGTQAEYVAVPAKYLFPRPQNINWQEAAAFPLAAMTAYHMLVRKVKISSGDWVLVYGASSGVGSFAIQIAKAFDTTVITTVGSEEKYKTAESLGADYVINYKKDSVSKAVKELTKGKGVDVVFEHTGQETWADSLRSLRIGGKLVTCGATTGPFVKIDLRALFIKQQQLIGSTMGTRQDLYEIIQLIEGKKIKPIVNTVFPYQGIKEAHRWLEGGKQFGKVVILF